VEITKETVTEFRHGHTPVGLTPTPIILHNLEAYKGILLRCPSESDGVGLGNTVPVYIGSGAVTANQSDTGGIPLLPGESIVLPIEKPSMNIFGVASALRPGDQPQDLAWVLI